VEASYSPGQNAVVENVWQKRRPGSYDSEIVAIRELRGTAHALSAVAQPCRYRHYLASSDLIAHAPDRDMPLAIGGHCLVLIGGKALTLKNKNGKTMTPGGVIDFADCKDGKLDIISGIRREIIEEIGFLPDGDIVLTGGFVGGKPAHIFFTAALIPAGADKGLGALSAFRGDSSEGIVGWELVPVESLLKFSPEISLSATMTARAYDEAKFLHGTATYSSSACAAPTTEF
jgi:hypothetical protein